MAYTTADRCRKTKGVGHRFFRPILEGLEDRRMLSTGPTMAEADLRVEMAHVSSGPKVIAGLPLLFSIRVTNSGPADAFDVRLIGTLPEYTTLHSFGVPRGWQNSFHVTPVRASIEVLRVGETASFALEMDVISSAPEGVKLTAAASVGSATSDPNNANNAVTVAMPAVQTEADLQVDVRSDSLGPVAVGSSITYTITVANVWASDAQGVVLTDVLPTNSTFISLVVPEEWSASTPPVGSTGSITVTSPNLPFSTKRVEFVLVVQLVEGTVTAITNTATVTSLTFDPRQSSNSDSETTLLLITGTGDFGDAPDTYGTLSGSSAARHGIPSSLCLGIGVDGDIDGQPTSDALGDDADGDGDDDDGVLLPASLLAGLTASASVSACETGTLDAWIDFDGSGVFDEDEQIAASVPLIAGPNDVPFVVPVSAAAGTSYARFRLSSAGGLAPTGVAVDGEVEDYHVHIAATVSQTGQVMDDPQNPGQGLLIVVGTSKDDVLLISSARRNQTQIRIRNSGQILANFGNATFQRVAVLGLEGNDTIIIHSRIRKPTELHGNDGNDRLFGAGGHDSLFGESGNDSLYGVNGHDRLDGGSGQDTLDGGIGHDVLLGAAGNDKLMGQAGRDILIGGAGSDYLNGGIGDDVLVGGTTDHDLDSVALLAILSEWMSKSPVSARVAHLSGSQSGGVNGGSLFTVGVTVHGDGAADQLYGSHGSDWFLSSISDADAVRDRKSRQDWLHRI